MPWTPIPRVTFNFLGFPSGPSNHGQLAPAPSRRVVLDLPDNQKVKGPAVNTINDLLNYVKQDPTLVNDSFVETSGAVVYNSDYVPLARNAPVGILRDGDTLVVAWHAGAGAITGNAAKQNQHNTEEVKTYHKKEDSFEQGDYDDDFYNADKAYLKSKPMEPIGQSRPRQTQEARSSSKPSSKPVQDIYEEDLPSRKHTAKVEKQNGYKLPQNDTFDEEPRKPVSKPEKKHTTQHDVFDDDIVSRKQTTKAEKVHDVFEEDAPVSRKPAGKTEKQAHHDIFDEEPTSRKPTNKKDLQTGKLHEIHDEEEAAFEEEEWSQSPAHNNPYSYKSSTQTASKDDWNDRKQTQVSNGKDYRGSHGYDVDAFDNFEQVPKPQHSSREKSSSSAYDKFGKGYDDFSSKTGSKAYDDGYQSKASKGYDEVEKLGKGYTEEKKGLINSKCADSLSKNQQYTTTDKKESTKPASYGPSTHNQSGKNITEERRTEESRARPVSDDRSIVRKSGNELDKKLVAGKPISNAQGARAGAPVTVDARPVANYTSSAGSRPASPQKSTFSSGRKDQEF